jgi:signal transduction histidine kinase
VALFVGDTWVAVLLLDPPYIYRTGSAPGVFWLLCYLLIPLAGLVRLRLIPAELSPRPRVPSERLDRRDVADSLDFVLPGVVVVAAGVVIMLSAALRSHGRASLIAPEAVGVGLLLLATLRPAVMFLEQRQLRRERDAARAQERATRLAHERMETFLGVIAHELRTPLTSLIGNVHLMARRLDALLRPDARREDSTCTATVLRTLVDYCDHGLQRMARLVDDVLDEARIHRGPLALRLEPCDLAAVVGAAVAQQAALNPERSIRWVAEASPVPVLADASRIEQVVTNFVSNALKFSPADQAVEVRMQTADNVVQVAVHDGGVGVPLTEQPHIWEQFYQVKGVEVQSGSQVGVGMGLYISKAIVEGHRGRVGIDSAAGQGTTIWFTLPHPFPSSLPPSLPEAGAGSPASLPVPSEHTGTRD